MFRLCVIELVLASCVLLAGVWCARANKGYCPYYSGIFTALIFLLNALVGGVAARLSTHRLYIAHLTLSIISLMVCIIGCVLAAR